MNGAGKVGSDKEALLLNTRIALPGHGGPDERKERRMKKTKVYVRNRGPGNGPCLRRGHVPVCSNG